ncbi:MAG: hypothetical protein SFX18_00905 [Pirellulales bacterium]|nr:hypothetical protein [Pirellulales bacterium]
MSQSDHSRFGSQFHNEYIEDANEQRGNIYNSVPEHSGQTAGDSKQANAPINELQKFTVLFKEGKSFAVWGHELKYENNAPTGPVVYSIVKLVQRGEKSIETVVAVFSAWDIAGIIQGELPATLEKS